MAAWLEIIKLFLQVLDRPSWSATLIVALVASLTAYVLPLLLVAGTFTYIGNRVVTHIDQGFDKLQDALSQHDTAQNYHEVDRQDIAQGEDSYEPSRHTRNRRAIHAVH